MTELVKLSVTEQKDQIIARLILQKSLLYVTYTEKWLDGFLTKKEVDFVVEHVVEGDKQAFDSIYEEVKDLFDNDIIKGVEDD